VGEVVKDVVCDEDRVSRLSAPAHDPDCSHKVVSPLFDDVKWSGVSLLVT